MKFNRSLKRIRPVLPHLGGAQSKANANQLWCRGCDLLAKSRGVPRSSAQVLKAPIMTFASVEQRGIFRLDPSRFPYILSISGFSLSIIEGTSHKTVV
jgi:hypothetical protein